MLLFRIEIFLVFGQMGYIFSSCLLFYFICFCLSRDNGWGEILLIQWMLAFVFIFKRENSLSCQQQRDICCLPVLIGLWPRWWCMKGKLIKTAERRLRKEGIFRVLRVQRRKATRKWENFFFSLAGSG